MSCEKDKCENAKNYILIYHPDGTLAEYAHVRNNGAAVKKDDEIQVGQLLGYVGATRGLNYSILHFEVYLPVPYGRKSIKTNFRQGNGDDSSLLVGSQRYSRGY